MVDPWLDGGGAATLEPMLSVRRGVQALDFYQVAFGARLTYHLVDESGAVVARLQVGQSAFWVSDEAPEHGNFSPETLGGGTVRLVLIVPDPQAIFERALGAGAHQIWPVVDQHGWRTGRLVDPFGHHWEIGKPLKDG